ncbi:MAG: type II toxin-antitoxin system HicA family toxin [Deltaproteobacteria bacterium]|nr:type II toxin-antitoxin system HicA family toxin [Deltaproteobacteria bacterium]
MPRITPVSWKKLECVFLRAGFEFVRQVGSHRHYIKTGIIRPVIIPAHNKPVAVFIIQNNLRTANMSRGDYFKYLSDC